MEDCWELSEEQSRKISRLFWISKSETLFALSNTKKTSNWLMWSQMVEGLIFWPALLIPKYSLQRVTKLRDFFQSMRHCSQDTETYESWHANFKSKKWFKIILDLICKLYLPRYGIQNNRTILNSWWAGGLGADLKGFISRKDLIVRSLTDTRETIFIKDLDSDNVFVKVLIQWTNLQCSIK